MGSRSGTMSNRAERKFHKRNPSQHKELTTLLDTMNREAAASRPKLFRWQRASSKTRESSGSPQSLEEKENQDTERRHGRPEKRVSWSKELLQVRTCPAPRRCRRWSGGAFPSPGQISASTFPTPSYRARAWSNPGSTAPTFPVLHVTPCV